MVYSSDFYTTRSYSTRPVVSSYSISTPRTYLATERPGQHQSRNEYSSYQSTTKETRTNSSDPYSRPQTSSYSATSERTARSGPGGYNYTTERSSTAGGGPGGYSYSSTTSGRLPGGTSYRHYSYRYPAYRYPALTRVYSTSYPIYSSRYYTPSYPSYPIYSSRYYTPSVRVFSSPIRTYTNIATSPYRVSVSPIRVISSVPSLRYYRTSITPVRVISSPIREYRMSVSPERVITSPIRTTYSYRTPSAVLAREYDRIAYKPRPRIGYLPLENYLNSESFINFDTETRKIRSTAEILLREIHSPVPRRYRSATPFVTYREPPMSSYALDSYIARITNPLRNVANDVRAMSCYPDPLKKYSDVTLDPNRPSRKFSQPKNMEDEEPIDEKNAIRMERLQALMQEPINKMIYKDKISIRAADENLITNICEEKSHNYKAAEDKKQSTEKTRLEKEALIEERVRLEEKERLKREARLAIEASLEEEARLAKEAQLAEEARLVEEARLAEERRLTEEAQLKEKNRLAEEARLEEVARLAEEARLVEEARLKEEARLAEAAQLAEEARLAEVTRLEEEALLAEEKRLAEEIRLAEEARQAEATLTEKQNSADEINFHEADLENESGSDLESEEEINVTVEDNRNIRESLLAEEARLEEENRLREKELERLTELKRSAEEDHEAEIARQAAELEQIARLEQEVANKEIEAIHEKDIYDDPMDKTCLLSEETVITSFEIENTDNVDHDNENF